jgi:ABC-type transport system involved in Fe-S cluster assembly fused permease/ATPase subunit
MKIRREVVNIDNKRNAYFVDSITNSETVKLFSNEKYENERYDQFLAQLEVLNIKNTY